MDTGKISGVSRYRYSLPEHVDSQAYVSCSGPSMPNHGQSWTKPCKLGATFDASLVEKPLRLLVRG